MQISTNVPEKRRKGFWANQFASTSLLEILIISIIAGGAVFYVQNIFQKPYDKRLAEQIYGLEKCQQNSKVLSEQSAYDKVRTADTTNILLALQDYNFQKGSLPSSLEELKSGGYFDGNLNDPEFSKPYYYKKNSNTDYILCIYLSTGSWGSNVSNCPTKEDFLAGKTEIVTQQTEVAEPKTEVKKVVVLQTPAGFLNIRKEPSLTSPILTKIYPGQEYEVSGENAQWIEIKFSSPIKIGTDIFNSGWGWKAYVK